MGSSCSIGGGLPTTIVSRSAIKQDPSEAAQPHPAPVVTESLAAVAQSADIVTSVEVFDGSTRVTTSSAPEESSDTTTMEYKDTRSGWIGSSGGSLGVTMVGRGKVKDDPIDNPAPAPSANHQPDPPVVSSEVNQSVGSERNACVLVDMEASSTQCDEPRVAAAGLAAATVSSTSTIRSNRLLRPASVTLDLMATSAVDGGSQKGSGEGGQGSSSHIATLSALSIEEELPGPIAPSVSSASNQHHSNSELDRSAMASSALQSSVATQMYNSTLNAAEMGPSGGRPVKKVQASTGPSDANDSLQLPWDDEPMEAPQIDVRRSSAPITVAPEAPLIEFSSRGVPAPPRLPRPANTALRVSSPKAGDVGMVSSPLLSLPSGNASANFLRPTDSMTPQPLIAVQSATMILPTEEEEEQFKATLRPDEVESSSTPSTKDATSSDAATTPGSDSVPAHPSPGGLPPLAGLGGTNSLGAHKWSALRNARRAVASPRSHQISFAFDESTYQRVIGLSSTLVSGSSSLNPSQQLGGSSIGSLYYFPPTGHGDRLSVTSNPMVAPGTSSSSSSGAAGGSLNSGQHPAAARGSGAGVATSSSSGSSSVHGGHSSLSVRSPGGEGSLPAQAVSHSSIRSSYSIPLMDAMSFDTSSRTETQSFNMGGGSGIVIRSGSTLGVAAQTRSQRRNNITTVLALGVSPSEDAALHAPVSESSSSGQAIWLGPQAPTGIAKRGVNGGLFHADDVPTPLPRCSRGQAPSESIFSSVASAGGDPHHSGSSPPSQPAAVGVGALSISSQRQAAMLESLVL